MPVLRYAYSGVRKVLRILLRLLVVPLIYLLVALICTYTMVNRNADNNGERVVYLSTNGIHLSVQIPVNYLNADLAATLGADADTELIGFGWGERNFLLNVPTWGDLDVTTAASAIFIPTPSMMHVSRWNERKEWMAPVRLNEAQWKILLQELLKGFRKADGKVVLLPNKGFDGNDDLYESDLSYHGFYTCNTWMNGIFKKAGLKACLWTPFSWHLYDVYNADRVVRFSDEGKWR